MGRDSAVWAWVGLLTVIVVWVVSYDVWAKVTHHLTMTTQFRMWLQDEVTGPFIFALFIAVPVGLMYHFLVKGR